MNDLMNQHLSPVSSPAIGAVVLAAGTSSRLGRPKQLLQLAQKPVFRYPVDLAVKSGLSPVTIVAGGLVHDLSRHLSGVPAQLVYNPEYQTGMASSLRTGLMSLPGHLEAVVVFLADQPLIPERVVHDLVTIYLSNRQKGCQIVRPIYAGVPGHPVLFDSKMFPKLATLTGDTGARTLFKAHQAQICQVEYENDAFGMDIDTEEDWSKIQTVFTGFREKITD